MTERGSIRSIKHDEPAEKAEKVVDIEFTEKQKALLKRMRRFFERNLPMLEDYCMDNGIRLSIGSGWAMNMEEKVLHVDIDTFARKEYHPAQAMFAVLHEVEHLIQFNEDPTWMRNQMKRLGRPKNRHLHTLYNCLWDVIVNNRVVKRAPSLDSTREGLYRYWAFKRDDMRYYETRDKDGKIVPQLDKNGNPIEVPHHLQFAHVILRREMLPDQKTIVAPEVEAAYKELLEEIELGDPEFDFVSRLGILEYALKDRASQSARDKWTAKFIEPIYERLRQDDLREQRGKGFNEPQSGEPSGKEGSESQDRVGGKPSDGLSGDPQAGGKPGTGAPSGGKESPPMPGGKASPGDQSGGKRIRLPFNEDYDFFDQLSPHAVPEDVKKRDVRKRPKKDEEGGARGQYMREHGLTEEEMDYTEGRYSDLYESVEDYIEPLAEAFQEIIQKRKSILYKWIGPLQEGPMTRPGYEAQEYTDIVSGVEEPMTRMERRRIIVDEEKPHYIEFTLIMDLSVSMEESVERPKGAGPRPDMAKIGNRKADRAVQASVLIMEALDEFEQMLKEDRDDREEIVGTYSEYLSEIDQETLTKGLTVSTEVRGFDGSFPDDELKPMGNELSKKKRVETAIAIENPRGGTNAAVSLEAVYDQLDEETREALRTKDLRKVVILVTDGEDPTSAQARRINEALSEAGVVVIGLQIGYAEMSPKFKVMMGKGGHADAVHYADELPEVIGEIIQDQLEMEEEEEE